MTRTTKTFLFAGAFGLGMGLAVVDVFFTNILHVPEVIGAPLTILSYPAFITAGIVTGDGHIPPPIAMGLCAFVQWSLVGAIGARFVFRKNQRAG